MDVLLNHFLENIVVYLILLGILIFLILLLIFKPKKVKPIDFTIDDDKDLEQSDIEKVIAAMEENKDGRVMTSFEEEQEANAIISYQELVKAVNDKKINGTTTEENTNEAEENILEDSDKLNDTKELNEAIDQIIKEENTNDIEENILEDNENVDLDNTKEKKQPKFKNSEFISPVFGKDNNNDKFLKDLKDFREKL